jgi:glycosyltransferase involved in cell wall biosynthesis
MAKISVLFPVYNVEAFVAEALASIQSQTFIDMEIVVVDDGSTDATRRVVEQIAASDPRIRVVGTPANQGLIAALNLGLQSCHAAFIARMDGDDIALPSRLEKQWRFLEENPRIALVGCATTAIDQAGNPIPGLGISRKPVTEEEVAKTMFLAAPCLHIWLARREVYDTLSGYRELPCVEDYDFLLRALTAGFRIGNLPDPLMRIRGGTGHASSRLEQRKAHSYIVHLCRERLKRGRDSFSPAGCEMAVKAGRLENAAFRLAMKCTQKGVRSHNLILRYFLVALSAVISPWQARYFLDRIRFKLAMRSSMRAL